MKLLRRLLPAPWISGLLLTAWLMLNASLSAGQVALGALLALATPRMLRRLRPERPTLRQGQVALRLALVVAGDIVLSSIAVGRRILGPEAAIRPRFV